jgi:hypothetical protein
MRVQVHRRAGSDWGSETLGEGDRLRLDSVDLELPVDALYEGV